MGEQALAAVEELAAAPVTPGTGDFLYADVLGRGFVSFSLQSGVVVLGGLLLAFAGLGFALRRGLLASVATILAALIASSALTFAAQFAIGWARGGEYARAHPEIASFAIDGTALASSLAILLWLGGSLPQDRLRTAFWTVFLLLGCGLAAVAPGVTIFFLAPPVVAVGALALAKRHPGWGRAACLIAWALLFLSWAPLLHLGQVLLGFVGGWIFAAVSASILLPALIELKPALVRLPRPAVWCGAALLPLGAWAAVAAAPAYSPDRKQMVRLEYALEDGKGRWLLTSDGGPLPAAYERFGRPVEVPWSANRRRPTAAPVLPAPAPSAVKVGERNVPQGRLVSFRLSAGGAEQLFVRAEPGAALKAVRVNGAIARFGKGRAKDPFFLRCVGRGCDGAVMDLLVASRAPLPLTLIGVRPGLPAQGAALLRARPADAQPQYSPDATIGVTRLRL